MALEKRLHNAHISENVNANVNIGLVVIATE